MHHGSLPARARHARRGDRAGECRQESVHRRRRVRARKPRARTGDRERHHAVAHARRGRSGHRPAGLRRGQARCRCLSMGGGHRDLRVSAGGAHEQSGHRRADARRACSNGATVVGAAPYTDTDPHAQIDRVFAIARDFDADIDMHLDLGDSPDGMDVGYVCDADRTLPLRRARDRRPRDEAVARAARTLRSDRAAAGANRRGGDRAAVHRSLPDGPPPAITA